MFVCKKIRPLFAEGREGGKKVKGFSTNITETCDEEGKPNIITHVDVEGATTADNTYVESIKCHFYKWTHTCK